MESLYYVICWACHRKCKHCYEERFRPYVREKLRAVVDEARDAFPKIVANLPDDFSYIDVEKSHIINGKRAYQRVPGQIVIAGGEVLVEPVRTEVLYPLLETLQEKWKGQGVRVIIQTTGDLVTDTIVEDLLARGTFMISVAGIDDFHVGIQGEKRVQLVDKLVKMFTQAGMKDADEVREEKLPPLRVGDGPLYCFFGANEDEWIGKIWPRGRAWTNGLSRAGIGDNFCNAWSGGLHFLNYGYKGSEVSIDPNGDVFPCCLKTRAALGNLKEEPLQDILESYVGHPAFEAIAMGHPERMGIAQGWDVATFIEKSTTLTPQGKVYQNFCIGCDRFHDEVLSGVIKQIRDDRRRERL